MRLALDFDGTIATCPRNHVRDFDDLEDSMLTATAYPAVLHWLRICQREGHELAVITGRGAEHEPWLRQWFRCTLRTTMRVVGRPHDVGLSCHEQATWKAETLRAWGAALYVGDNPSIDLPAARMAGVRFIDAHAIQAGTFPTI